jgi:Ca2+-binding RTX toxin-like protein
VRRAFVSLFLVAVFAGLVPPAANGAVCTITGTAAGEVLDGTAGDDVICGLGGDDTINGLGGNDVLDGGKGADTIDGGADNDRLSGGDQDDQLSGGAGIDVFTGGAHNDTISGGSGNDEIYGEAGDDIINGDGGDDYIRAGAGSDELYGGDDNDRLAPGLDNDSAVDGGNGRDRVEYRDTAGPVDIDLPNQVASGQGNDSLASIEDAMGSPLDDTIIGLDTGSALTGREGADTLIGGAASDTIRGDSGDDNLDGGGAADVIYGSTGVDTLNGGDGDDTLRGGDDGDTLNGDANDDYLFGEAGDDTVNGGTGNDRFTKATGTDATDGGDGTDTLSFSGLAGPVVVDLVNDGYLSIETVIGTAAADTITGDGMANTLDGGVGSGGDTLTGAGGNDKLYGWGGADTINGGADDDYMLGHDGVDATNGGAGNDNINAGTGDDDLIGGDGNDSLTGFDGVDTLSGGTGNDAINPGLGNDGLTDGGADTDTITYGAHATGGVSIDLAAGTSTGGSGNDAFQNIEDAGGTSFDDTIFGNGGPNRLSGKNGIDTINGRGGIDMIFGGEGDDFIRGGSTDLDAVDGQNGSDTCGEFSDTQVNCEIQFNLPPVLTIVDNTNTFTEGEAAKAVDSTLTFTDDEANAESATITIGSGFESGKDFLSVSGALPAGVAANYVAPTLTISGTATVAQYETMLRNVRFENTSQDPSVTNRTITFSVFDGEETDGGNDVTMGVLRINDAPVADTDSYSGGNHGIRLRVGTTHADAHEVELSGNVLDGDSDVDTPTGNLTTTPGPIQSTDCAAAAPSCSGNVTMASDGTFTYDPPAGGDTSDSFQYTVEDNDTGDSDGTEDTHTNTVTIGMSGTRAWFVDDSSPTDGRGVSHDPAQSLARLSTGGNLNEEDGLGDRILVYSGTYTSGLQMENEQKLLGEPHGLNIGGTQFVAAGGTPPAISHSGASVVTLGLDNEIQDLALGNGSTSLAGTSIGTAVLDDTTINNAGGRAIEITTGGTFNPASFDSVSSSNSPGVGVGLTGLSGTIGLGSGTIQNATGTDFHVSGGNAAITYSGAISDGTGRLVNVANTTGGSRSFTGAVTDAVDNSNGSTAVSIDGASGTNSFTGNVQLISGADHAVVVNNSPDSTTIAGGTNRLDTTTGSALRVTSSNKGNMTFERIDSDGAGSTNPGIILDTTTGTGTVTVTGTGGAGSGGTIANKTGGDNTSGGNGIHLNSTNNVSLSRMNLSNFSNHAIFGSGVNNGFKLLNSVVSGTNGNNVSIDEGSVVFSQLTGVGHEVTASNISGGAEANLQIRNTSGSLNRMTVDGTTFGAHGLEDNLSLSGYGTAAFNFTMTNSFVTQGQGDVLQHDAGDTATSDLVLQNNQFTNNHPGVITGGGGMTITSGGSAFLGATITGNSFRDSKTNNLLLSKLSGGGANNATLNSIVQNNTFGTAGATINGSSEGSGISIIHKTRGTSNHLITGNAIRDYSNYGIGLTAGTGVVPGVTNDGTLNATIYGNTIAEPNSAFSFPQRGIFLEAGTNTGDAFNVCFSLGTGAVQNTITGAGAAVNGGVDMRLRQRMSSTVRLPGYDNLGNPTNTAVGGALYNYVDARTNGPFTFSATTENGIGFNNTAGGAACPTP